MKVISRARRYGSTIANTSTSSAPTPATIPSWRSGSPAATSIDASVNEITNAVPRSGCAITSSTAQPPTPITGTITSRRERAIFGRSASTAAECRISASFISSDGWNCSGPAPSHRRAPLISSPIPGTSTSSSSTNAPASSHGVNRRTCARLCRDSTFIATSPTAPYARYLIR